MFQNVKKVKYTGGGQKPPDNLHENEYTHLSIAIWCQYKTCVAKQKYNFIKKICIQMLHKPRNKYIKYIIFAK